MLDESEWKIIAPFLFNIEHLRRFAEGYPVSLAEARDNGLGLSALAKYEELTGRRETDVNAVRDHRATMYGPPCKKCGKPLRTFKARFCAGCWSAAT
jgi:hypothetical protein